MNDENVDITIEPKNPPAPPVEVVTPLGLSNNRLLSTAPFVSSNTNLHDILLLQHAPKHNDTRIDDESIHKNLPRFSVTPASPSSNARLSTEIQSDTPLVEGIIQFGNLEEWLEGRKVHSYSNQSKEQRFQYYSTETGRVQSSSIEELGTYKDSFGMTHQPLLNLLKKSPFWLDVCNPSSEEMKAFSSIFHIHPLTVEDILTESTREKFDLYKNYYFITYATVDNYLRSINISILVYPEFVLTFHRSNVIVIENVMKRLDLIKSYLKITPYWINYAILDEITDRFVPLVDGLSTEIETIDELVLILTANDQADMLKRISVARKGVTNLLRQLAGKENVIRVLLKRIDSAATGMNEEVQVMLKDTSLYVGDVMDHVITMHQTLVHFEKTLARSHSNYLAQINIDITRTTNESNVVMNKMTALASLLVPLNVITGLWGMNVNVPGQTNETKDYSWFFGIIFFMLFATISCFYFMRKVGVFNK